MPRGGACSARSTSQFDTRICCKIPNCEIKRLWKFLGVRSIPATIGRRIRAEMNSNPDEEWQSRRGQDIASFLAKGKAGNWRPLLTPRDKDVFKEVAGNALVRWNYERSGDW